MPVHHDSVHVPQLTSSLECLSLFITCSSYLGLSIHNRVQTGKRIRLIGLQTLSEGSIIVLDALMLFSIAACMACILIIVDLVYKYRIYVLDADAPWQLQINSLLLMYVLFHVLRWRRSDFVCASNTALLHSCKDGHTPSAMQQLPYRYSRKAEA